ncbi:MAG: hypothetical protein NTV43_04745 [Methylococcales bacterium]|nr:hypothetical protein [Methylococcales bacterium]
MAYNNYTLDKMKDKLAITDLTQAFLPTALTAFVPSNNLLENLADAIGIGLLSEKSKSEHIIVPVLKELRHKNPQRFSYFSGYLFNIDSKLNLNGYCDFILSAVPNSLTIDAPIFCLVEAKKGEIEEGFGQCGAEMYAAQLFNQRHNNPQKVIYGCVTNAFTWCFLKLEQNVLAIDPNYIPLTFAEPHKVLAVLQWILDESLQEK